MGIDIKHPDSVIAEVIQLRETYKKLEKQIESLKQESYVGIETKRCLALAYTELQSSRHWLGEVLGTLGVDNPYDKK